MPDFIIAGAMRSGTTSLFAYLRDHPEVTVPRAKELHFFDRQYDRGFDWYADQFPPPHAAVIGEATPNYMFDDRAMDRIAHDLPTVKLVVLLRNPTDRAYSHYWHDRSRDKVGEEFETVVERELAGTGAPGWYVARGMYEKQLGAILDRFPQSAVHVSYFDDLRDRPAGTFMDVCGFLGIDTSVTPPRLGTPVNAFVEFRSLAVRRFARRLPRRLRDLIGHANTRSSQGYPPMTSDLRRRLDDIYRRENSGLADLIGRPVPPGWWGR